MGICDSSKKQYKNETMIAKKRTSTFTNPEVTNPKTKENVIEITRQTTSETNITTKESIQKKLSRKSDFTFLEKISRGAQSNVYLVRSKFNKDKTYAMKVIPNSDSGEKYAQKEIENLSKTSCNFIVKFYEYFRDSKNTYLTFEFCGGEDISTLLYNKICLDEKTAKFYMAEIYYALRHLHKKGIIYRDLKPENVMLDDKGHIKLIDLGVSTKITDEKEKTIIGTLDYIAPEVLNDNDYCTENDWWSFGILMFQVLLGYTPYQGRTFEEMKKEISEKDILNEPKLKELSFNACDLISSLLVVDKKKRISERDIIQHPWFRGIDKELLFNKKLIPPKFQYSELYIKHFLKT